jgi:hypothetical protein
VNHEIAVERKKKIYKKKLLSDGLLLWWSTALLDWLFPLSAMALGVFSSGEVGREDVR